MVFIVTNLLICTPGQPQTHSLRTGSKGVSYNSQHPGTCCCCCCFEKWSHKLALNSLCGLHSLKPMTPPPQLPKCWDYGCLRHPAWLPQGVFELALHFQRLGCTSFFLFLLICRLDTHFFSLMKGCYSQIESGRLILVRL